MQVQLLHFLPRPGRFAQKFEAGLYAWFVFKAVDVNIISQAFPTVHFHEVFQDHLQGFAVQGIVGLLFHFCYRLSVIGYRAFRLEWVDMGAFQPESPITDN